MDEFLSVAFIPIFMFGTLVYYAIRLLVFKDVTAVRGLKAGPLRFKDQEKFTQEAGKLLLFLALGSLVMLLLLFLGYGMIGLGTVIVWVIIFGILWKRMDNQYGEN